MIPKHFHQDSQTSRNYHFPLAEQGKAVIIRAQVTVTLWWAYTPSPNSPHSMPHPFTLANFQPHLALNPLHTLLEGNRHASLAPVEPQLILQVLTQAGFLAKLLSLIQDNLLYLLFCSQWTAPPTTSFIDANSVRTRTVSFLNILFSGLRYNNDLTVSGQTKSILGDLFLLSEFLRITW